MSLNVKEHQASKLRKHRLKFKKNLKTLKEKTTCNSMKTLKEKTTCNSMKTLKEKTTCSSMGKIIAIDGNIGVGKTTFMKNIAESLGMIPFDEEFLENPHLENFYKDPKAHSFATQTWFIVDRVRAYKEAIKFSENTDTTIILDRPPSSTLVFTTSQYQGGLLTTDEYEKLLDIYESQNKGLREPDLYIYLDATPKRCLESILLRGREMEKDITLEYLEDLGIIWKKYNPTFYKCPYVCVNWEDYGSDVNKKELLNA